MAEPIQRLLKKGAVFTFGAEQRAAMDSIRTEICKEGKALKRYNATQPRTCTSTSAMSALSQKKPNLQHWARVHGRLLLAFPQQTRTQLLLLQGGMFGCRVGVQDLSSFLHGRHITIVIDHEPLEWFVT